MHTWSDLAADATGLPEARLTHKEAREISATLQDGAGVVGFAPTGPIWTLLRCIGVLVAIGAAHWHAWRLRIDAEARQVVRTSFPAAPVIAPAPATRADSNSPESQYGIRPAPERAAAPPTAPAAPVVIVGGDQTTGLGIPGMPVMSQSERMAPPA